MISCEIIVHSSFTPSPHKSNILVSILYRASWSYLCHYDNNNYCDVFYISQALFFKYCIFGLRDRRETTIISIFCCKAISNSQKSPEKLGKRSLQMPDTRWNSDLFPVPALLLLLCGTNNAIKTARGIPIRVANFSHVFAYYNTHNVCFSGHEHLNRVLFYSDARRSRTHKSKHDFQFEITQIM
jgi:hypothetical protein